MKQKKTVVAPSILAANLGDLTNEIKSVERSGADWIHIDVMDGSYVPPITFGDNVVAAAAAATKLPLDVHLMINNPEAHIETFAKAGSHRIIIHQEASVHLHRALNLITQKGAKAGVAINPATPVELVFDVLDLVDLVLVMTVNPGWGGQSFIPSCADKVSKVAREIERRGKDIVIEVDGGINAETAKVCREAGATVMVAGSYIFGNKDRSAAINSLRG